MVSQNSPPFPNSSSIPHQFLIPDSIASNQSQHFDAYSADLRGSAYPPSLRMIPCIQSLGERMSRSIDLVHAPPLADGSEMNHSGPLMDLLGASDDTNHHQAQKLSLSLGSRMAVPSSQQGQRSSCLNDNYYFMGSALPSSFNQSCGPESFAMGFGNSMYLKPAQSLLQEVVNFGGKDVDLSNQNYVRKLSNKIASELKAELCSNGVSARRHELHVKIAKLVALLEEVESRFEEYFHHMEDLVSSFEAIAGLGAGKSYTAMALQAMCRHFCSLRDAIISQINLERKKILQDMPKISIGLSQLSLFDRETRHNNSNNNHNRLSLQQLGMMHSPRQTWRPLRGLPETSVTILRAWLFEHFLHPYPNDSEKLMLASQTGLTKNQVANWFINARVRLWKPMIEEMYREEFVVDSSSVDSSNPLLGSSSEFREGLKDHEDD